MSEGLRVAMWSGPRNISTALMRAWDNRGDTTVSDEPFYAHYLVETAAPHPGRDEIVASQSTNYAEVAKTLTGPIPGGKPIWYQKHMAQHVLPDDPLDWLAGVRSCFLIRSPEEVVASFTRNRPDAAVWELGFEQQGRLFDHVCEQNGTAPPVLDAADVLKNPAAALRALCESLGVSFSERMLHWPAGPRTNDGVWAKYWYRTVEASTGFQAYRPRKIRLTPFQHRLADRCRPFYARLAEHRLEAATE